MKNRYFDILMIEIIVATILILYMSFLYIDFYNVNFFIPTEYLKFLSIVLCFLLAILSTKKSFIGTVNYKDMVLLQLALFLTVIADLCLVIFDFYISGLVFFSLVQITYCVRHTTKKLKVTLVNFFIVFLCIVLLYMIASLFIGKINILLPISLFYSICLISSVIKAIKVWKNNLYPSSSKYMIALGMILFLLCDICVALSNITVLLPLMGNSMIKFQYITSFLIWFFYLPSQLLLALSGNAKIFVVFFANENV